MRRKGIVIGGGAAGLMAAITAAQNGAEVTIIEHMPRVGKKILSTGNGKCNLTNLALLEDGYRCSEEGFPMKAVRQFPPSAAIEFFRTLGVVTMDRNGYVYPASGQAQTILDALRDKADSLGIAVVCGCEAKKIESSEEKPGGIGGPFFTVITDQGKFFGDFVILAAGSMAAKNTGSDGSGYELARGMGHRVKKPLPALVQLRCSGGFFKSVAGVRTEAQVFLWEEGKQKRKLLSRDRGELQLTDYGISGIPVFQVSRFAAEALDQGRAVTAVLDFYPSETKEGLLKILKDQKRYLAGRPAEGFLNGLFNKKLAALFLREARIPKEITADQISRQKLLELSRIIKEFQVTVTATNSYDQAQVCMGGVLTKEVDPLTMESRLVPGLYFAGEILDVDGICGGYNLQWAWSSGFAAGKYGAGKCRAGKPGK